MAERDRLGKLLVDAKLITGEQLQMAIDFQKAVGGKLGAIIVKLGFIEDRTLLQFIARQAGIPVVNLDELVLPENLVKRIPRKLIEKHHVLPIQYKDGVLTVAMSDPYDFEAIEELQLAQDARIEIHLAPRTAIQKNIAQLFDRPEAAPAEPGRKMTDTRHGEGEARKGSDTRHGEAGRKLIDTRHGEAEVRRPADRLSRAQQLEALVPLLLEKGIITQDDLLRKSRELEAARER